MLKKIPFVAAALTLAAATSAQSQPVIGLITKTETNPFFVKMKEGAAEAAKAKGAKLLSRRRQDRRRQRRPGDRDGKHDRRRRQDHPDHAQRQQGHRSGHQEGARQGRDGDRPGQPDRPGRRDRRPVRHRQLQGRRADRPVRQGRAGWQAGQDRHARPVPRPPGGRAAPQRLPEGLRPAEPRRQEQRTGQAGRGGLHGRQLRRPRQGPDGDGKLPAEGARREPWSTPSTSPPPPAPTTR